MEQLITLARELHEVSLFITIFLVIYLYFKFLFEKDYVTLTKKYERYSLVYFFFLGVLFFTGLVLFTVMKFQWSLKIILMIMAIMHMTVTSIKLHKVFKRSNLFDESSQESFKSYSLKKYFIDILVLILIGFIAYAIHI